MADGLPRNRFWPVRQGLNIIITIDTQRVRWAIEQKNPAGRGGTTGFCEKGRVGVEPTRDGFAIRCLSHLAIPPNSWTIQVF